MEFAPPASCALIVIFGHLSAKPMLFHGNKSQCSCVNIFLITQRMEIYSAQVADMIIIICTQEVAVPEVLYEEVIEVDERVVLRQDGCQLPKKDSKRIVTGARHKSLQDEPCKAVLLCLFSSF